MALFKKNKEPDMVERSDGLTDYNVYVMKGKEKTIYIILAAIVIFAVGMLFYHNVILALILSLIAFKFPKMRRGQIIAKRKRELNTQFKDLLYSLSSSMTAGRSLEMAFKDALKDMSVIYPNPETPIMVETAYIVRLLEMNEIVENAITQFADRAHIEDISNFADIVKICKRTGGNMIEVIRSTSSMIGDKIETKNEIETTITAKKFESRILTVVPILMVAVLSFSSPDYMEPVFTEPIGAVAMTVAVILFVVAFLISEKIMDIEV